MQDVAFNPFDPTLARDPFPAYAALRAADPVHIGAQGLVCLASYEHVLQVLRDRERFGKRGMAEVWRHMRGGALGAVTSTWLIFLDPPTHSRVRSVAGRGFTPARVATLGSFIRSVVDALLQAAGGRRQLDIVQDLAYPPPIRVTAKLLDIPTHDLAALLQWVSLFVPALSLGASPEEVHTADEAMVEYREYFRGLLANRRAHPGDDLLTAVIQDRAALSDEELVAVATFLFVSGYETTTDLIACAVLSLMQHPNQRESLQADPALIGNAVEESLHYWMPTQYEFYSPNAVSALGGKALHAGQLLVTLLGSANRDEEHFSHADTFDVQRLNSKDHLALGQGVHYCLGAPLARLEAQIAIPALFQHMPGLQLACNPNALEWKPGLLLRGLKSLPATF